VVVSAGWLPSTDQKHYNRLGRILTTLCNELARRDGRFGLLTVCAAGGMGHAMVVERA
jgi:hypothetical protein